jgi:hypothetical protein
VFSIGGAKPVGEVQIDGSSQEKGTEQKPEQRCMIVNGLGYPHGLVPCFVLATRCLSGLFAVKFGFHAIFAPVVPAHGENVEAAPGAKDPQAQVKDRQFVGEANIQRQYHEQDGHQQPEQGPQAAGIGRLDVTNSKSAGMWTGKIENCFKPSVS